MALKKVVDITKNNNTKNSAIRHIPLDQIVEDTNVRETYENIEELAESILEVGQLEPIAVEEREDGKYKILMGHRRFLAFKHLFETVGDAAYRSIRAELLHIDASKREIVQLIENIQREDLTSYEEERALRKIMRERGVNQEEMARLIGKHKSYVSRAMKALEIRERLEQEGIATENIKTRTLLELDKMGMKEGKVANWQLLNVKGRNEVKKAKVKAGISKTRSEVMLDKVRLIAIRLLHAKSSSEDAEIGEALLKVLDEFKNKKRGKNSYFASQASSYDDMAVYIKASTQRKTVQGISMESYLLRAFYQGRLIISEEATDFRDEEEATESLILKTARKLQNLSHAKVVSICSEIFIDEENTLGNVFKAKNLAEQSGFSLQFKMVSPENNLAR